VEVFMPVQPIVSFRDVRASAGLVSDIERRVAALDRYYKPITSCRVLIERATHRHASGNRYHVRIDLAVPGGQVVVKEQPATRARARADSVKITKQDELAAPLKHVRTAITQSFAVARRQLQDFARRQRGA